jgi:hypothetical protein
MLAKVNCCQIANALTDRLSSKANASTRVALVGFETEEWVLL